MMVYALVRKKKICQDINRGREREGIRQRFVYLPPGMIEIIQSIPFIKACLMIESRTEGLK